MSAHHEHLDLHPQLVPALGLMYRGLSADADLPRLLPILQKLLHLDADSCRAALKQAPLLLAQDAQRDKLRKHQMALASLGCISSLEDAWQYRGWAVSDPLKLHLDKLEHQGKPRIFALLNIEPAPGHTRLMQLMGAQSGVQAYVIGHAHILLEADAHIGGGAGRWLRAVQQDLARRLKKGACEGAALRSALALFPDDASNLPELLDTLQSRLDEKQRMRGSEVESSALASPPQWTVAGLSWAQLMSLHPEADMLSSLEPPRVAALLASAPLGEINGEALPPPPGQPARMNTAQRIVEAYRRDDDSRTGALSALRRHFLELDRLPSLPSVAMRAYQLAREPSSSAQDMARMVEQDPSLSSRILTIVNSAYFGLRKQVDSIAHALVMIGAEELAHLAILVSSERVFRGLDSEAGRKLWQHSARTAEIARVLAQRIPNVQAASVYTAALLHDVGKIFLYSFEPQRMQALETEARELQLPTYELERASFGHDRASLGGAMLRRWGLPDTLCEAVEQHHGPLPDQTAISPIATVIALADHLAHRLDGSQAWADQTRLRQHHVEALKPLMGVQDLDTLDLLAEDLRGQLRDGGV